MNSTSSLLLAFSAGAMFGAAMMYVLDPELGERRRTKALDQVGLSGNEFSDMANEARNRAEDLSNRAQSTVNEARREMT